MVDLKCHIAEVLGSVKVLIIYPNSKLIAMFREQLMQLLDCRGRRKFMRGMKRKPMALIKRLRKAKKEAPALEKPECVKTHLRNMIILPEMIGSVVGVYNGKTFNQVEIKVFHYSLQDMIETNIYLLYSLK